MDGQVIGGANLGKALRPGEDSPVRENIVQREINHLHLAIDRLSDVGGGLVNRLHPILSPEGLDKESDKNPIAPLVPLAEEIRSARMKIESMVETLIKVTNRIEL